VIVVSVVIDAPPSRVWQELETIERHVDWMVDAVAIRFTTDGHRGVGTRFDCDTKVGPAKLVDQMEITEWEPDHAMGVRHVGLVTGAGRFVLQPTVGGGTLVTWSEELDFPWWLGGRLGSALGGRLVLARLWRRNLQTLKGIVEH
jgi:uncharacterized protein YndB with AHSA1/START domain